MKINIKTLKGEVITLEMDATKSVKRWSYVDWRSEIINKKLERHCYVNSEDNLQGKDYN